MFFYILRVSMLEDDLISGAAELRTIESQLLQRYPLRPKEDYPAGIDDEDLLFNLYRIGCLLYLKRTLSPQLAHQSPEIQDLLSEFVSSLEALPSTSPANGVLCWPLVVAGLEATIRTHRRSITGRLRKINETWTSDILKKSEEFLSETWRDRRNGGLSESLDISCAAEASRTVLTTRAFEYPAVFL